MLNFGPEVKKNDAKLVVIAWVAVQQLPALEFKLSYSPVYSSLGLHL